MIELDEYENDILGSYERGELQSTATKEELARPNEIARSAGTEDRRVNIRLSSSELHDIQARALAEGIPYQTLIASVLHKYVTGRLIEPEDRKAS